MRACARSTVPELRFSGTEPVALADVDAAFAAGFTVSLRGVHQRWRPVHVLCSVLQALLGQQVSCNLYHTPPGTQGLPAHFDDHDALVLQVAGRKRWAVFSAPMVVLPPLYAPRSAPAADDLAAECVSVTLAEGSLLYIPRQVQRARTRERANARTRSA